MIYTKDYNIDNTGLTLVTEKLQKLIDENDEITINEGTYLVSPLFLHNNTKLIFDNAILIATLDENNYKDIYTRVAGIEMNWYPAIINAINTNNVEIKGNGIIDGNGNYWYRKYWGIDTKGGMRKEYDQKNIRFLCDYDCKRPRNILIQNSNNILIDGITSKDSGFWNIHILYSSNVIINNINISSDNINSPSTDGIDIDSSHNIEIKNSIFATNDDSIAIKSGRDYDGRRINIPSYDINIHNLKILTGFGITLGSELSAGIKNVNINNIEFINTDCAFRIKSSKTRGGYINNIHINNFKCINVKYIFNINLNWNPLYNKLEIPSNLNIKRDYLDSLLKYDNPPLTMVDNIYIDNIYSRYDSDYLGINRLFHIEGYNDKYIDNIYLSNLDINSKEYGYIKYINNLSIINSNINYKIAIDNKNNEYDNR